MMTGEPEEITANIKNEEVIKKLSELLLENTGGGDLIWGPEFDEPEIVNIKVELADKEPKSIDLYGYIVDVINYQNDFLRSNKFFPDNRIITSDNINDLPVGGICLIAERKLEDRLEMDFVTNDQSNRNGEIINEHTKIHFGPR